MRPTSGFASSICIASAWWCAAGVRGIRMALNMPVASYRGVAIRLSGEPAKHQTAITVVLEHRDPALSLPLFASAERDDIVAEWQSWGRVLGLPLLVAEDDGSLREPFARMGALRIEAPTWRRRRRSAIAKRRPSRLLRRRAGQAAGNADRASRRTRDHRAELISAPAIAGEGA